MCGHQTAGRRMQRLTAILPCLYAGCLLDNLPIELCMCGLNVHNVVPTNLVSTRCKLIRFANYVYRIMSLLWMQDIKCKRRAKMTASHNCKGMLKTSHNKHTLCITTKYLFFKMSEPYKYISISVQIET